MATYKNAFPSRFFRASDLPDEGLVVMIEKVALEPVADGEEPKLTASFVNQTKRLVVNKTNAESIAAIVGSDDVDDWPDHEVKLVKARVDFRGKRVDAIRIDPPPPRGSKSRKRARSAPPQTDPDDPLPREDDDEAPSWVTEEA